MRHNLCYWPATNEPLVSVMCGKMCVMLEKVSNVVLMHEHDGRPYWDEPAGPVEYLYSLAWDELV